MARNIEIKAKIGSVDSMISIVATLAPEPPTELIQDDTFFRCDTGRLKLRELLETCGELIYYRRDNSAGPKESFYVRSPTEDPRSLRDCLALAYGVIGRVRKVRKVYFIGRTRIHLDKVEDLGDFLELEVVLANDEPAQSGVREAEDLMTRLGIRSDQILEGSYLDILVSATSDRVGQQRFPADGLVAPSPATTPE